MNSHTPKAAHNAATNPLIEHYRCPAEYVIADELRLGDDPFLHKLLADIPQYGSQHLFDAAAHEVIDYCRLERYAGKSAAKQLAKSAYYFLRPFLPFRLRNQLKKVHFRGWEHKKFPHWPVDCTVETILQQLFVTLLKTRGVEEIPFIWFWPEGYSSCVIMTHDVEATAGKEFCSTLMDLNDRWNIKSSFQLVPEERYAIPSTFLEEVRSRGFEINIHDLNHDGHLFDNHAQFLRRVKRINRYANEYGAKGFRAGAMYRNPDWYEAFDLSYDMSFPNVAHLDPQQGGCCTVIPFFIGQMLELPLTTAQDYFLFHALNDYSLELWKQQIDIIMKQNGLISFLVHPDYIISQLAQHTYVSLLSHIAGLRSTGKVWVARPSEVDQWWRERSQMKLQKRRKVWSIEGKGNERARVAYATMDGDSLRYVVPDRVASPDHTPTVQVT